METDGSRSFRRRAGLLPCPFLCDFFRLSSHPRSLNRPAANEMPSVIQVPAEAQASPHFDAMAATNAYLAQIPADKTARSDAYFEGGYWMILWDFLYARG